MNRTSKIACFVALACSLAQDWASAQTPAPAPGACSNGTAPALSEIACELGRQLAAFNAEVLVVPTPLVSSVTVSAPQKITSQLASLVAGAIGPNVRAMAEPLPMTRARAVKGPRFLITLEPVIKGDKLAVTANVFQSGVKFWQRVRSPEAGAVGHGYAVRSLDPELRSLLPPIPLVVSRVDKARSPDPDPVALACGDVDGDGWQEIAFIGRRRITIGRVREAKLAATEQVSWTDLGAVAGAPLRQPIATARIQRAGTLDVGLTDRAEGIGFNGSLRAAPARFGALLPWPGGGCAERSELGLAGKVRACSGKEAAPGAADFGVPLDAIAGARLLGRDGKARVVYAGRLWQTDTVVVIDRGRRIELKGAGAELAVGDLDGDGDPEIVASANTLSTKDDLLTVQTWRSDGKLVERFKLPVPGGVRALTVCNDREESGFLPLVVASGEGLWVVR